MKHRVQFEVQRSFSIDIESESEKEAEAKVKEMWNEGYLEEEAMIDNSFMDILFVTPDYGKEFNR